MSRRNGPRGIRLSEVSLREKDNTIRSHGCGESKNKNQLLDTENRLAAARGRRGWVKRAKGVKRYKLPVTN